MSSHINEYQVAAVPISNRYPLVIIGTLFFIFGFVTWLRSVLIPYLQLACELTVFALFDFNIGLLEKKRISG